MEITRLEASSRTLSFNLYGKFLNSQWMIENHSIMQHYLKERAL